MWVELALGKVLVGKVPGFISVVLDTILLCKIKTLYIELLKFLYKWLIMSALKLCHTDQSHGNYPVKILHE